jgi:hypothetical protein
MIGEQNDPHMEKKARTSEVQLADRSSLGCYSPTTTVTAAAAPTLTTPIDRKGHEPKTWKENEDAKIQSFLLFQSVRWKD